MQGAGTSVSEAGNFSVKVTGDVSGAASVVVGQSVEVVAETVGSAIIASGKVIAFIPMNGEIVNAPFSDVTL